jgi:hypothetical protein
MPQYWAWMFARHRGFASCGRHVRHLCAGDFALSSQEVWGGQERLRAGRQWSNAMTFKVYSGPAGTDAVSPIHKDRMLFKEFPTFDEALSWASHVKDTGRVAVLLEDETGRTFNKREIAAALADRDARDVRGITAQHG